MARGEHIYVQRSALHAHHAIDVGDGTVIHYWGGESGRKMDSCIRLSPIAEFAKGGEIEVRQYGPAVDPDEVVERAMSRLGEGGFNLIFNNCEHFATWCVTGQHESAQVVAAGSASGVCAAAGGAVHGGRYVVTAGGAVPGVSGAGIMSGLRTAGAAIGGGVMEGIVVLGAVPAIASAALLTYCLRDKPWLPDDVRAARRAATTAAWVGGGAGTIGTVAAVWHLGVVPGVSASGISSGLSAIGGFVGGGMAAGAWVTLAVPTVCVGLFGLIVYKVARHYYRRYPPRFALATG